MHASRFVLRTHAHIKRLKTQLKSAVAGKGIVMFTKMFGTRTLSECCVAATFGYICISLLLVMLLSLPSAADLRDGLINYWPLDGDATDNVGKHDGEVVGAPAWVKARVGKGVELDGGSQKIHIPDYKVITKTTTYAAWINGWKASAWAGIVGSRTPTATELIFGDNDLLHYVWNNNSAETWRWDGGPEIPMETWALAAMAIEPKHAILYIYSDADGLTKGVNDIPHVEQPIGPLNIGWVDCCGGNRYFKGIIDEVMIFDRALSEDEILKLAEQGLAVEALNKLATTWGRIKRSP